MANVLLLALSNWNKNIQQYHYRYVNQKEYLVDGYLTNEAPAKALIDYLADSQERIDKIIMLASDTVRVPIGAANNIYALPSGNDMAKMNTAEYYKDIIDTYSKSRHQELYQEHPISFCQLDMKDDPDETQITEAIIECSNEVISGEKTHVYIDYNGGQRFVAFMIVAISDMMKLRNVSIEQILAMEHKPEANKVTPIQDRKILFDNMELISGLNECVNYGRIKTLKKHFGATEPKLFAELEHFVNDFQLCRIDEVTKNCQSLCSSIEKYKEAVKQKSVLSASDIMLNYVIGDIEREYYSLLHGTLPEILAWCVDKDFIQQGLTFCTERLPEYLWLSGKLCPTEQERQEYENHLQTTNDRDELKYCRGAKNESVNKQKTYVQRAYYWLISYIPRNWEEIPHGLSGKLVNDMLQKYKDRWKTNLHAPSELTEIIDLYFVLKDQRNFTNHASVESRKYNCRPLSYDELRGKIIRLTKLLNT